MRWLYRLLFLPALVVLAPRYLLRMRRRGGYAANFGHRFGGQPRQPAKRPGTPRVWLQAVSVGEMLAVAPVLEALQQAGVEVYLTTTTSTGYRLALDRYAGWVLGVGYFPIDCWPFVRRAWRAIEPDLVILTEGERWPELLRQAEVRGVPVLCINARMSDRSFARLQRWPAAARLMTAGVTRFLAGSAEDAARFVALGVPAERVAALGNIKLDVPVAALDAAQRAALRRELGLGPGLVLLGSSTWPGEEAALLAAWRQARREGVACSLLLVPRHAERRAEIERSLAEAKVADGPGGAGRAVRFHFRSRGPAPGEVEVAVGDTTGELRKFTQLADVVFVGKSLAPHTEGQTPVEAAAAEKPILFGPGMSNFRAIAPDLVQRGAAEVVADPAELAAAVGRLLRSPEARGRLAAAAAAWRRENAGAVGRTLAVIRQYLSPAGN
jgi:3-deoxy-D-manno-octulosonic-acid transferase